MFPQELPFACHCCGYRAEPTGRRCFSPRWTYNGSFHLSLQIFQYVLVHCGALKPGLLITTWELIIRCLKWPVEDKLPERPFNVCLYQLILHTAIRVGVARKIWELCSIPVKTAREVYLRLRQVYPSEVLQGWTDTVPKEKRVSLIFLTQSSFLYFFLSVCRVPSQLLGGLHVTTWVAFTTSCYHLGGIVAKVF